MNNNKTIKVTYIKPALDLYGSFLWRYKVVMGKVKNRNLPNEKP